MIEYILEDVIYLQMHPLQDTDFNLRHLSGSPEAQKLFLLLAKPSPSLAAAARRPGAPLLGAAAAPNLGRFGALSCRCPFGSRLLTQCAAVAKGLELEKERLRRLSKEILGEEVLKAFGAFEAKEPGAS